MGGQFWREDIIVVNDGNGAAMSVLHVTCHWNVNGRIPGIFSALPSATSANSILNAEGGKSATTATLSSSLGPLIIALEDMSVNFRMGTLTCIIGAMGSGKSALFQMFAGKLLLLTGSHLSVLSMSMDTNGMRLFARALLCVGKASLARWSSLPPHSRASD